MDNLPVTIRSLRETDKAFILDSWVNSICYSTPAFFWVPTPDCKSAYYWMVGKLIKARPELFRVLVNEDNEDQIFAWICGNARVTHFVFVKKEFRDNGLASMLVNLYSGRTYWVFSHFTKDCEHISKVQYKPSLFKELINGINKTLGGGTTTVHKHLGESDTDSPD